MASSDKSPRRYFTEAARLAAVAARAAKRANPDVFGRPALFVVAAGDGAFTWELRRFGGIVLARGPEAHASMALARAEGETALATLLAKSDLPRFKKETRSEKGSAPRC